MTNNMIRKKQTGELAGPGTGVSGGQFATHTGSTGDIDSDLEQHPTTPPGLFDPDTYLQHLPELGGGVPRFTGDTPWGEAQTVYPDDRGIVHVSTASHGGMLLSAHNNQLVPEPFREESGWYDEDDGTLVMSAFLPHLIVPEQEVENTYQHGVASMKNYWPDQWEQVTGREVALHESYSRKEAERRRVYGEFRDQHAHDPLQMVTTGFERFASPGSGLPEGTRQVEVIRDGQTRQVLVPASFWRDNGAQRTDQPVVLRPQDAVDVTDALQFDTRTLPVVHDPVVAGGHLSDADQRLVDELWREDVNLFADGTRESFAEHARRVGVTHRSLSSEQDGDQGMFGMVHFADGSVDRVPRIVYESLGQLPDASDPVVWVQDRKHQARARALRVERDLRGNVQVPGGRTALERQAREARERVQHWERVESTVRDQIRNQNPGFEDTWQGSDQVHAVFRAVLNRHGDIAGDVLRPVKGRTVPADALAHLQGPDSEEDQA